LSFGAREQKLCVLELLTLHREKEISMLLRALSLMIAASLFLAVVPGLAVGQEAAKPNNEKLMNPAQLTEMAPEKFQVKFDTTKGEFIVDVTKAWAPNGADRFYNLVINGFYNNCRFFRVVKNFMVQFGINGDPKISRGMMNANIKDDKPKQSNTRGMITFAMSSQPNSRTSQVFISFRDNSFLDPQGFAPFGKVSKGMDVVDAINNEYGENPDQGQVQMQGNAYLQKAFPNLDYIKSATIIPVK
jgi:peptidyl-prolyl cis-trans isomerase A (cyclophilin A)